MKFWRVATATVFTGQKVTEDKRLCEVLRGCFCTFLQNLLASSKEHLGDNGLIDMRIFVALALHNSVIEGIGEYASKDAMGDWLTIDPYEPFFEE